LPNHSGLGAILRGLVGYNADPMWLEVVGWAGDLIAVGGLFLRTPKVPGEKSRPLHEASSTTATARDTDVAR
jgi:high-affinity Fe2+/Pb2+ permease